MTSFFPPLYIFLAKPHKKHPSSYSSIYYYSFNSFIRSRDITSLCTQLEKIKIIYTEKTTFSYIPSCAHRLKHASIYNDDGTSKCNDNERFSKMTDTYFFIDYFQVGLEYVEQKKFKKNINKSSMYSRSRR